MPACMNPETARAQLRSHLASYFHAQGPAAPSGYPQWKAVSESSSGAGQPQQLAKLLVGDPVVLLVC